MYRESRARVLMSAEEAAFRLHIGVRSLYRYECGEQIPPADVVCMMAETYRDMRLLALHCTQNCPIGMQYGCPMQKETAPCGAA